MSTHKADATALLDQRGYRGPLIRGQNPAHLIEPAVRDRITGSLYWMEQCYGLNAATLCDRAVELTSIGGTVGNRATPFLCLAFKLLQLVPKKEVILEYLLWKDEDTEGEPKEGEFKYVRALAAFYIRLTWEPVEIFKTLEPLLSDYRKLRRRVRDGFVLTYMDQFVDDLLTKDRVCATALWKLPKRTTLEDLELLEPRDSPLGDELDELDRSDAEMSDMDANGTYSSSDDESGNYAAKDRHGSSEDESGND
jgi:pre-mRNA-splicing factor 38A